MVEAVYAIDESPDDDLLWRIEWIGGVVTNPSVPTDPLIDVCLAQLPGRENNPLGSRLSWFFRLLLLMEFRLKETKSNGTRTQRWPTGLYGNQMDVTDEKSCPSDRYSNLPRVGDCWRQVVSALLERGPVEENRNPKGIISGQSKCSGTAASDYARTRRTRLF
jgi:hypothetical protein